MPTQVNSPPLSDKSRCFLIPSMHSLTALHLHDVDHSLPALEEENHSLQESLDQALQQATGATLRNETDERKANAGR